MAKGYLGCNVSTETLNEFEAARANKFNNGKKLKMPNKGQSVEEALLMYIKKYGVKK